MDIRKLSESTANRLKSNPELVMLEALASAFALVATADGEVDRMEASKYFDIIKNIDDLRAVPVDDVENAFTSAVNAIKSNETAGAEQALTTVGLAKGNSDNVELILSASQAAIVADLSLKDSEDAILRKICGALGVDPDAY